jgi:hypothetical protein
VKVADRKRIFAAIESWKPMLGLSDWLITVSPEPPSPGRIAECHFKRDLRVAEVRVRADALEVPALENLCLLHELLHLTPAFEEWERQLEDNTLLETTQRHALETLLDDVARWILVAAGNEFPIPAVS